VKTVNPNADTMGKGAALHMNINAAKGMYDVLKTNLGAWPPLASGPLAALSSRATAALTPTTPCVGRAGPRGTIKMLVGGSGGARPALPRSLRRAAS
jgi:hypothetical protein